jgi:hypothetical protein
VAKQRFSSVHESKRRRAAPTWSKRTDLAELWLADCGKALSDKMQHAPKNIRCGTGKNLNQEMSGRPKRSPRRRSNTPPDRMD